MSVLKIKGADGEWVGVTAIKGDKGDTGMSPQVTVNTNTNSTYKLRIVTEDKDFITPNLKGGSGSGGSGNGNISMELGTIDNYKDFDGKNIPAYNMDLPPLPCYAGGTKYVFEKPVTMLVYAGEPDANGNYDIDKYVRIESVQNGDKYEVSVKTAESGFLTDYLIYNAVPKQAWDTWTNPNLIKMLDVTSNKINYDTGHGTIWCLPNNKFSIYQSGEAYIDYVKLTDSLGNHYTKPGQFEMAVYNRKDFPFILDEPVKYCAYDKREKQLTNPVNIEYPSPQWTARMQAMPRFKLGLDYTVDKEMNLSCCGEEEGWGNSKLMRIAQDIQDNNRLEDRAYDLVIASPGYVNNQLTEHCAKPLAPAMYVGLAPLKNYTIETLAGDCAIVLPENYTKKFITKSTQLCYPSTVKTVVIKKGLAQDIGTNAGGINGGTVTGISKLENGSVMYYDVVDTSADPDGTIEVPTALSCPNVYLKRGESYTFQVEDEDPMYGIWVCCLDEEDYSGVKIVEGIEPYSALMAERMASGATKFNIKVYTEAEAYDDNEIMAEYNIKLCDTTTATDYCRFLNTDTIKHYDLDDFTMNGHKHNISDIIDKDTLNIPKMEIGTSTLVDGVSELGENTFYFVYSE